MKIRQHQQLKNAHLVDQITADYIIMKSGDIYSTSTHYIASNCIFNVNGCLVKELNKQIDIDKYTGIYGNHDY